MPYRYQSGSCLTGDISQKGIAYLARGFLRCETVLPAVGVYIARFYGCRDFESCRQTGNIPGIGI